MERRGMKPFFTGTAFIVLGGCAPIQINNQLIPIDGQKLEYIQGAPLTRSIAKNSVVFLALKDKQSLEGGRVQISIAAENIGQSSFNFGVESLSITDGTGRSVTPVPYEKIADEIQADIKRREALARYMAVQALTAQTTTVTQQYGNFSGSANFNSNTYGPGGPSSTYGNAHGSGTYSGQATSMTVNPAQNAAAASAWLARGDSARAELGGRLGAVSATYLKTNTVHPGASIAGHLYLEPNVLKDRKGTDTYAVTVTIGEDVHNFKIQRVPQQQP